MSERSRLVALVAVCATIVYICTLAAQHHAHLQQLQHELSLTQLSSAATGSPAALRPPRSLRRAGGASAGSEVTTPAADADQQQQQQQQQQSVVGLGGRRPVPALPPHTAPEDGQFESPNSAGSAAAVRPAAFAPPAPPSRPVAAAPKPTLAIHLFAFNRPDKFERLWTSLMRAQTVSLLRTVIVIHVDYDAARSEEWQQQVKVAQKLGAAGHCVHGPVSAIIAAKPKGLRVTMLEAWAPLPGEYAMFLEDDIEVSPLILVFAERFILTYGEQDRDPSVLGFKLYNQKWDEVNQRMEAPINNDHAPFKIQEPCSWGSIFVPEVYAKYLAWYTNHSDRDPFIPYAWSNTWDADRSAKKYMQRFMWEQGAFLIAINLPDHLSLTSPKVDKSGTNIKEQWLEYLRTRLEVPLVTLGDIEFMRSHDIDPFIMPKASTLVMLNASHHIVKEVKLPTADQIAALDSDTLPPRELLDPLVMRGARWRLLEKGTAEIKQLLQDMRPPQLFHKDVTPRQDAALRTLLVKEGSRGGAGLEAAFVDSIKDRGMLFTIARILLGPHGQSTMIVETQYGMTNRLRAYGSAKAIAESSGRFLVVIWEPDFHFAAPLEHVFSAPRGVHVVSDGALIRALLTLKETKRSFVQFDLMDPAQKSTLIDPRIPQHIYVRSAFQILCKQSYGMTNILAMRELVLKPSDKVQAVLRQYYDSLPEVVNMAPEQVHEEMIGVHVRMVASVEQDTPGVSEEEALRMELATAFRVSCHYKHFGDVMRSLPSNKRFFVSADASEAYTGLRNHPQLKGRIFYIDSQSCTDRSAACLVYAAADLVLLTRTSRMLTSRWSAFSEVASKVGGMEAIDACDQPPGGWKMSGTADERAQQIIEYLQSQNFPDVDRVRRALQRFK